MRLLNKSGRHHGGCEYATSCNGATCSLPEASVMVEVLNHDIDTPADHIQEQALAQVLAVRLKTR